MAIRNLKFELAPKIYGINTDSKPAIIKIGDFIITESFSPNSKYDEIAKNLGDYKVIIEKPINSKMELQESHHEITALIDDLDRAWMYSCGHPLTKKNFAFMAPIISQANGNFPGWSSNYKKVESDLNKGKAHAIISIKNMHHSVLPYWPLKSSGEIREKYLDSLDYIKALIDLHYFAHKVGNGHAMLFFLAKALELIRSILPGKNDDKKEEQLPSTVRDKLHSSFHKILGLANTRFEIRHIVKDPKDSSLHQKLTHEEIDIFKNDSDLIIRAVVAMELDIPLCIPARN
jgi:hypothetical protein